MLGAVGSRLNLSYERMDDLQLPLLSALDACDDDQTRSMEVEAQDDVVSVSVGPLRAARSSDSGLARVLDRLVDSVDWTTDDGADRVILRLVPARVDGA